MEVITYRDLIGTQTNQIEKILNKTSFIESTLETMIEKIKTNDSSKKSISDVLESFKEAKEEFKKEKNLIS